MKKIISVILIIVVLIAVVGCVKGGKRMKDNLSSRKVNVVATTGMIGDMAAEVGGDRVIVNTLMGPGVDPHLYKASEGDVSKLSEADIIFYNGLHLEGKMAEVLAKGSHICIHTWWINLHGPWNRMSCTMMNGRSGSPSCSSGDWP